MPHLTNYKGRALAIELIAQQSNDLADKLTALYEEVYKCRSRTEAQGSQACKDIVDLLQKRIGVKVNLIFNTDNPPACMPVMANTKHVLSTIMIDNLYDAQTEDFLSAIKKDPVKKGTIDLKNAKLGGVYSTIACPVWMAFNYCKQYFTPRECAAVMMHEIGHLFLAFEMMYRTVRASQVLAHLHQVRTGRDTSITYEHALEVVGTDLTKNPREFIDCVTMDNDTAVSAVVFTRVYHKLATDFGENAVAGVNFEVLSDNFSAKWGLAPELVSGLSKLYGNTALGRASGLASFALYMSPLSTVFVAGAIITVNTGVPLAGLIAAGVVFALSVMMGGRNDGSIALQQTNVYDKPFVRMQRIRETVVQQLKFLTLEPEAREHLLKQIESIDALLKGGKEMSTITEDLSKIFTSSRRADFAFKLERDIELLANNDLFVNAQRLAAKA